MWRAGKFWMCIFFSPSLSPVPFSSVPCNSQWCYALLWRTEKSIVLEDFLFLEYIWQNTDIILFYSVLFDSIISYFISFQIEEKEVGENSFFNFYCLLVCYSCFSSDFLQILIDQKVLHLRCNRVCVKMWKRRLREGIWSMSSCLQLPNQWS